MTPETAPPGVRAAVRRGGGFRKPFYDVLVIGSGFGGAMAAHALIGAGARVLMLERGRWPWRDQADWNPRAVLLDHRYRNGPGIEARQRASLRWRPMPVNEVVGGMSVFYGAASLRLRPADFERWPISYGDLEPHYCEAERLLGVHGTDGADPHEPPRSSPYPFPSPALARPARRIRNAGRRAGLQPFPMPLAINFSDPRRPECVRCDTCDGFPCRIEAKNDVTGLLRQAERRGLAILDGMRVLRLEEAVDGSWTAACVRGRSAVETRFRGARVVLAAGAVGTPALLIRSGLDRRFPRPMVGRFLMRHDNAVVAGLFPSETNPERMFHKQICFTDGYEDERRASGFAGGVIQDIYTPTPEVVRAHAALVVRPLMVPAFVRRLQNLLCVAEDEPQWENRVAPPPAETGHGRVRIRHRYAGRDHARLRRLTRRARLILRAAGAVATHAWAISSFSHAVGTVRMAASPDDGPVDPYGRYWGSDNLYVADGSVFPASGGVNPSLTIAANALRTARRMAEGR